MDYEHTERMVEGYLFMNEGDAELARQEKKKIEYLKQHINYSSTESVLRIYKKAIAERIFKTPVGHDFLKSYAGAAFAERTDSGRGSTAGGAVYHLQYADAAELFSGKAACESRGREKGTLAGDFPDSQPDSGAGYYCHVYDYAEK